MDIQSLIKDELWQEIKGLYNSEHYSSAVFVTVKYLSNTIREKSGLDGDGVNLVNLAFGGDEPKLKINNMQTHTEKDIQKGMLFLLQGIYMTVKNPLSHEKQNDDQKVANTLILFIDYLISEIDLTLPPFTIDSFIQRVNDVFFVETSDYAKALVDEIPKNRLFDTLVEVFRLKIVKNGKKRSLVVREILNRINNSQKKDFFAIVSKELKTVTEPSIILSIIDSMKPGDWSLIEKSAKLRIENQLLSSIIEGECMTRSELFNSNGALGTWAIRILSEFEDRHRVQRVFLDKLESTFEHKLYVFSFFAANLPAIFEKSIYADAKILKALNEAISDRGRNDSDEIALIIKEYASLYPKTWTDSIVEAHPGLLDPEDDIPF